jgi:hypothetical protein
MIKILRKKNDFDSESISPLTPTPTPSFITFKLRIIEDPDNMQYHQTRKIMQLCNVDKMSTEFTLLSFKKI